jgi:S-adenosyl-L-methionine hydrolase (adenosine-forming)
MKRSCLSLITDFGMKDGFAGTLKGVILGINPAVQIVDLSHEVPPQDILAGALILRSAVRFFPSGTIHVAVVDPGVGSTRRALLLETPDAFFIGPDNGLLSLAVSAEAVVRIVELTNTQYLLSPRSATFHGRDVFAPAAAHLSLGVQPHQLGSELTDMERLSIPAVEYGQHCMRGCVLYIDQFGNLMTNVTAADLHPFPKERLSVSIATVTIGKIVSSYAAAAIGKPVALINSWGLLEIAVRNGSAAQQLNAQCGCVVSVTLP